jgi:hypothetical protein
MGVTAAVRLAFVLVVAGLAIADRRRGITAWNGGWTGRFIAAASVASVLLLGVVALDHLRFPLVLETMEGIVLQHAIRAAHGQFIYPAPTPAYVPLAYNPGFYVLAAPFIWVFGASLATLRVVAILGMAGAGIVIYAAVTRMTGSRWWGLAALGLYASAYRVMDSALDNAHADSWLLCFALLGTELIARNRSRRNAVAGIICCVAAFWCKQHGALFVVGALAFLTWRDGLRGAWLPWVVAILLGPVLYLGGNAVFGPDFHFFTWTVPSGWSVPRPQMVVRLARFFALHYLVLTVAAVTALVVAARHPRNRLTVWHIQLLAALCTAAQGTLDTGSSENVFISAGAFLIVVGVTAIATLLADQQAPARAATAQMAALALAYAPLIYNPQTELLSGRADASYADMVRLVRDLHAPVYAPEYGWLPDSSLFYPGANWVALDDIGRGPHRPAEDRTLAASMLGPVEHPAGGAGYVLTIRPLDVIPTPVRGLAQHYTLVEDFGDRFQALHGPPKTYGDGYPRLLYRYTTTTPIAR